PCGPQRLPQRRLVQEVGFVELDLLEAGQILVGGGAGTHQADNLLLPLEEQLREGRPILAPDPRDERPPHGVILPSASEQALRVSPLPAGPDKRSLARTRPAAPPP